MAKIYQSIIGLEVHVELGTASKMFCGCKNDPFGAKQPNIYTCPVCLGMPGALPVPNKKAIEWTIMLGQVLGCEILEFSKFDRKNYFYPDLPKGYQISQYDLPFCKNGALAIKVGGQKKIVRIRRVHLEEDTGKLMHAIVNGEAFDRAQPRPEHQSRDEKTTLIDFNRSGVPLMEIVTEPDIHSGEEAKAFLRELQLIVRYLGISDADLEKGSMRLEPNISVRAVEPAELNNLIQDKDLPPYKVEVKNINSFRFVAGAIDYETKRHIVLLKKGEIPAQETRGWNPSKSETFIQRRKETADDYRYFPEPDIPPIVINKEQADLPAQAGGNSIFTEELKSRISELPQERRLRFQSQYFLNEAEAEVLVQGKKMGEYFEQVISELEGFDAEHLQAQTHSEQEMARLIYNFLTSDLKGLLAEQALELDSSGISPEHFAHLILMFHQGKISSRTAKEVLREMLSTKRDPEEIVVEQGLEQVSDSGELEKIIAEVISSSPLVVADYRKGKTNALQFLVGQVMAKTKGAANPQLVRELLVKELI